MSSFEVPYGRGSLQFGLPPGVTGRTVSSAAIPPVDDVAAEVRRAISTPIGTPRLSEIARGAQSVCIAVTDATRACPDHLLVPPMLEELALAGVPDSAITILVAVGTHRASTEGEKREKLGDAIVDRYRVIDHDASDRSGLVKVADGPEGVPFQLNRTAIESDLLIATGKVEPHQYAGFSGGGKTIAIGCAGEEIIAYTHGPAMLDREGVRLAELASNPFQQAVRMVAAAAKLRFVANVVMDDADRIVEIGYGDPVAVHDHLAVIGRRLFTVPILRQADIAVAGVGYPKDANLYQASRAASYLQFAPTPVVRPGGVVIIPAACPEGAGEGKGEQRFAETMAAHAPAEIIRDARLHGIRPGEQRAYVMARVLESVRVIVAGVENPAFAERMGFLTAPTIEAALEAGVAIVGTPAEAVVVPHALLTLPVVTSA